MNGTTRAALIALTALALGACHATPEEDVLGEQASIKTADQRSTLDKARLQAASVAKQEVHGYTRPGYFVEPRDGRLWVFLEGTQDLEEFRTIGEPAKTVTRINAGPDGMTLRGPSREVLTGYAASTPRYHARVIDGRLWLFDTEHEDVDALLRHGPPADRVTVIGKGPDGMSLCATERETIYDWLYGAAGFHTEIVDERLWVLAKPSRELEEFRSHGELAKSVTRIKAGPGGITLRGPSSEVLDAYLRAKGG